ncbi:hypothetical protein OPV22_007270 [Ensete ventricosum]|uniref:Uncharacterized protein n=2 Tax=Ensete ventricosum TaxID=4639 RepID=A0AAV8RRG2_ENSVE|nr:hypothetical protein OPV22_007270 [Ensete ventricosum]RWW46640.1 hypothetical protein BHE74_00047414 [Ensete ventricosum]RZS28367.1 hypothetical protein BHM03_00061949 [Ensete ventricosum]
MATSCVRSLSRRNPLSSLGLVGLRSRAAAAPSSCSVHAVAAARCTIRRFSSLSRIPVELGCYGGSLIPLHSAVAASRLTSRLSTTSRGGRALSQGTLCRTYPGL